jgi:hypothetical protein
MRYIPALNTIILTKYTNLQFMMVTNRGVGSQMWPRMSRKSMHNKTVMSWTYQNNYQVKYKKSKKYSLGYQ